MRNFGLPALGGGAGLRHEHFKQIIDEQPAFKWFEVISENFLEVGGYARECFEEISRHYPVIPHCVGLSVGSTDALDMERLNKLRQFVEQLDAPWTSDHLCFTMIDHSNLEDLIPLPFTTDAVNNVVDRIKCIQDTGGRPFLVENVTRYVTVSDREMGEAEFIARVLEGANCGLLLDITNVQFNSKFHGYDAMDFIQSLPLERVGQIHLAGWEELEDGTAIDSHDAPVPPEIWELYRKTLQLTGPTSVLVEWDAELPPVERLLKEAQMADELMQQELSALKEAV